MMRSIILTLAHNGLVKRIMLRHGLKLGAKRFVAGTDLATAMRAVADLNRQGFAATLDHLGEFVDDASRARSAAEACLQVLDQIRAAGEACNISVKLTQLGLDVDSRLCRDNMVRIVQRAAAHGNFVRIDMEDSTHTDSTLALFRELVSQFGPQRVGVVLQSYLYRTGADLEALIPLGASVRLCKGAYLEPPAVAFPRKSDVDTSLVHLVQRSLQAGLYTAVATHDERIIRATRQFAAERGVGRDRFEFQMLFGIRRALQQQLVAAGYRVRVYVPFGLEWYGYFTRRLAERPANVLFVLANLLRP